MSEDVIWQILDEQFCSFKAKFERKSFCKNEYNLTGMCNKMYCPLANGRYATIREEDGKLYLHIKTIERAHTPANLWEKIELPEDMGGAVSIINENLAYWPKRFVNKVKERLVRLHQYLIRYRKWYYRAKPRLVTVHKKFERREQKRELKSLVAAKLDTQILQELQERFDQGVYDNFINLNHPQYMELLREAKRREEKQSRKKPKKVIAKPGEKKTNGEEEEAEEEFSGTTFVEADDDDVQDIEEVGDEDEDEMEDEMEAEEEDEEEAEVEEEGESFSNAELRKDILKHIALSLDEEKGDDSEIRRLKRDLLQSRKRKLEHRQKQEAKRVKDAQKKKKHYGAHVEIEYEGPTQQTTTSTTSW